MADRQVTQTLKDKDGDILALCNPGMPWSPRRKRDAITDIEDRLHTYHVIWDVDGKTIRTEIHVEHDLVKGKYLRTDLDDTTKNNLTDLPNC